MSLYYTGSLDSAFAHALATARPVACLICDNGSESICWKEKYMHDEQVTKALCEKAVLVEIPSSSTEASQLAAFYSIVAVPTIIFILHGNIMLEMRMGVEPDLFKSKILKTLAKITPQTEPPDESRPAEAIGSEPRGLSINTKVADKNRVTQEAKKSSSKLLRSAQEESSPPQKPSAVVEEKNDPSTKEEILQDKAPEVATEPAKSKPSCAIQVRLGDGRAIRSKFPPSCTIVGALRPWIDQESGGSNVAPYTLTQILSPTMNRALSASDEQNTLAECELMPTSTLVMVPVGRFSTAYEANQSYLSRGIAASTHAMDWGSTAVSSIFSQILAGKGGEADSSADSSTVNATGSQSTRESRSSTKERKNAKDPTQLDNGNNLCFEPNDNDDIDHS